MRKIFIGHISILMALVVFLSSFSFSVNAACSDAEILAWNVNAATTDSAYATSGRCNNFFWKIEDNTLTISGTGVVGPFDSDHLPPWEYSQFSKNIERVVIEEGISCIKEDTFLRIKIKELYVPTSLIEFRSFLGYIDELHISDLRSWCSGEYYGLSAKELYINETPVRDLVIPEGITSLKSGFNGEVKLDSITFPESIESIGYSCFFGYSVKKVVFKSLESLMRVNMKEKNYNILTSPIYINDKLLTDLEIPEGVTKINDFFLAHNKNLRSVSIPSTVKEIGEKAFHDCEKLERIKISDNNPIFSDGGSNAIIDRQTDKLILGSNKTTIPDYIKEVGDYAFYGKRDIKKIEIPDSVESVGDYAFANCLRVEKVYLPAAIENIGSCAFGYYHEIEYRYYDFEIVSNYIEKPIAGFSVYAKFDTPAMLYAFRNGLKYVDVDEKTLIDEKTGVSVSLVVECVNDKVFLDDVLNKIGGNRNVVGAYDLGFSNNGKSYSPVSSFEVNIPVDTDDVEVYEIDSDSPRKLNATVVNEKAFFTADKASRFVIVTAASSEIVGDVNDSRTVDITDATLVQMNAAKLLSFNKKQIINADVNHDGKVDITDATFIQMAAAKLIEL